MSPLDSSFLRLEDRHQSLHIASVAIFEGPPPSYDEMSRAYAAKLPLVPRYRQRVREVPLWLGRPVWVDDPHFNLRYHLRHTALPRPGSDAQLRELVGRLMSQALDRGKPLWETWVVDGLDGDRWAIVSKVHHCMVDGIAGTDLLSRVLDTSPEPSAPAADPWDPAPEPGALVLLASAVASVPHRPASALRSIARSVRNPRQAVTDAAVRARGMAAFAELAVPAAPSSLSGPISAHRRWAWATATLDDVRVIRKALGGTVNDVVLAAVTSGFRDLLLSRGETPKAQAVRTLVPVSVRRPTERGQDDNRVSAMIAELPVGVADPVERLAAVRAELARLKRSGEPEAGEFLTSAARFAPPVLLAAGLTGVFRFPQRQLVTVTTNVPGPRAPLYAAGRRMLALYPYVPIATRVRVGVAIESYVDELGIGVTADYDTTPDIAVMTAGIEDGVRELLKAAKEQGS